MKYNNHYKPRPMTDEEITQQLKKIEKENPIQKKKTKRKKRKGDFEK